MRKPDYPENTEPALISSEVKGQISGSTPVEQSGEAEARSGVYRLYSHLFACEMELEELAFLRQSPETLVRVTRPAEKDQESWLKDLRVEYARLFLLNVYPFESIYASSELMLNTEETEQVREFYLANGFKLLQAKGPVGRLLPDHLAAELYFMEFVAKRQAQALSEGNLKEAFFLVNSQSDFLREHLLSWLPVFALAVISNSREDFYRELIGEILAFLEADLQYLTGLLANISLNQELFISEYPSHFRKTLAPQNLALAKEAKLAKELVDQEDSSELGFKRLVRRLVTPVESGFYLTKEDMYNLGRTMRLPLGVGDRFQMLQSLFEAAAQFELLPALFQELTKFTEDTISNLKKLEEENSSSRNTKYLGGVWETRLKTTLKLFEEMKQALVDLVRL